MMTNGGSDEGSAQKAWDNCTPLPTPSVLMRMATGYLARYGASSQRVRQVLERRIQRRCRAEGLEKPDADALAAALDDVVARLEQLGLLDDRAFAAGRVRALQRKGLPEQRIRMALRGEGLNAPEDEDDREVVDDATQARRYAARKRLGPFRRGERLPFRDKDLRSLLRAGFPFRVAVETVDADPEHS